MDQDNNIGWEVAYLLCRVYNAVVLDKFNKKLSDKFMGEFLSAHFID